MELELREKKARNKSNHNTEDLSSLKEIQQERLKNYE